MPTPWSPRLRPASGPYVAWLGFLQRVIAQIQPAQALPLKCQQAAQRLQLVPPGGGGQKVHNFADRDAGGAFIDT